MQPSYLIVAPRRADNTTIGPFFCISAHVSFVTLGRIRNGVRIDLVESVLCPTESGQPSPRQYLGLSNVFAANVCKISTECSGETFIFTHL